MNVWGWIVVGILLLLGSAGAFLAWAMCVVAKQADEWMEHINDEWEVGG